MSRGNLHVIPTDTVFHVLDSEGWRWNVKVKAVSLVNNDGNIEASLLEVLTGQLIATHMPYRDFITTTHAHTHTHTHMVVPRSTQPSNLCGWNNIYQLSH